jgi:hypothetical protein
VAAHPDEAEGISFWTGRAATPGNEQLLPLLDEAWERNKALTDRTLGALYATNRETIVSYCIDENISHILLNTRKYTGNIMKKAETFQPFRTTVWRVTGGLTPGDLVLTHPPEDAVVFHWNKFSLIDVSELRKEWGM